MQSYIPKKYFTTFLLITLIPLPMYFVVSEMTNIYLFKVNSRNIRTSMQNMFSANHNNARTTSLTWFWCFYC